MLVTKIDWCYSLSADEIRTVKNNNIHFSGIDNHGLFKAAYYSAVFFGFS
jgi:hypothetical protein